MTPLAYFLVLFMLARNVADATIGVDWGRQSVVKLSPAKAVDLLLQNGILETRLFYSDLAVLESFKGSNIELTLTINGMKVNESTCDEAKVWVEMRKPYFIPSNIRQIIAAEYAFGTGNNVAISDAMKVLKCMQKAINDAGFGDRTKVVITHTNSVVKMNMTSLRPSEAEFRDDIKQEMATFLSILQESKAPFVTMIAPIFWVNQHGIDINFAMFDGKSSFSVEDVNGLKYTNAFELIYDSFVWSLIKLNASDIKVKVGYIGWPTRGGMPGANAAMAERFFKGLLPLVSSKGTPKQPGVPIDIMIHSLTDEDKGISDDSRSWGIYNFNGKPNFKLDLSGQGADKYPVDATGIMGRRWCVFNQDRTNATKVTEQVEIACSGVDCKSAIGPGGHCGNLDFATNVSYAFNMHFQSHHQNLSECAFGGLGYVSFDDPSVTDCAFPVESNAFRHTPPSYCSAVFLLLLSVVTILFSN